MRTLYSFNMMTLDGFFEGTNPWDLSWHNTDEEFNDFAIEQMQTLDTIIFGRRTYEGMAGYWTSTDALRDDPAVAAKMNSTPKIVVSTTLDKAEWNNTHLIKTNVAEELLKLKQQPGKDLAVFGSANLLSSLIQLDLVDEHRIMLNPVVLGKGTPLFNGVADQLKLCLAGCRTFKNGNVLLTYQPAPAS